MKDQKPKGALGAMLDNVTGKVSEGGAPKGIRRRTAKFTIAAAVCEPDTFPTDFEVEVSSLSQAEELEAFKEGGETGSSAVFSMAKRSLRTIDGEPVRKNYRDLVWDALGFGGRTVVVNHFTEHCLGVAPKESGDSPLAPSAPVELG